MLKFDSSHDGPNGYALTQIMTASPLKLQLMLVQGALRNCHRARDDYRNLEFIAGGEYLLKTQAIFSEIIAGALNGKENPLSTRIVDLYAFMFRTLITVHQEHDQQMLDQVIGLLEIEAETWTQLCEKHGGEQQAAQVETLASPGFSFQA